MLNSAQLLQLCQIARLAGDEIMAVYAEGGEVYEKADHSPLTEADLRADRVISQGLRQHFSQWAVVSEESGQELGVGGFEETFFLVDPLDGTKEFIQRNGEFTVNIALIHSGKPVAGVVYAPALNALYFGALGQGVFRQDANGTCPIGTAKLVTGKAVRVIGSRSHGADRLKLWLNNLNRSYSFVAAGSSLKFCRVAEGEADVYPRFGPTSQWDTAAAQAILELAGGCVISPDGDDLAYGVERPVLNTEFMAIGDKEAKNLFAEIECLDKA